MDNEFNKSFRLHPWHGLSMGERAPHVVNCYIEMVPADTIKYELDKISGMLKVDRPQQFSSLCPSLYGLLPKTYSDVNVAEYCRQATGREDLKGDGDPLDICVFTEKTFVRGDILLPAIPIGGFSILDGDEVDDKIIAVMQGDLIYGGITDISACPKNLIERLRHYFLTYKDDPNSSHRRVELMRIYGRDEAHEVIRRSVEDYNIFIRDEEKNGRF
jgi:inorganic pyrophosphatase